VDPNKKTFIIISDDFDKALAALMVANGAAAMGNEVTMFFAFWGLDIIRRPDKRQRRRSTMHRAFDLLLPRGPSKLQMSKLNFGGIGPILMRKAMKDANLSPLEELLQTAQEQEIRMIACGASMDALGFEEEDLIPGVEVAGVATYFDYADDANVNLLI
jgi:peroxiredoxin family protein